MARNEKLDLLGVSAFCESLGLMVKAGIQVSEAIGLLEQKQEKNGILESSIESMEKSLEEGNSLKDAMEKTGLFPDYALRMIAMGESTGKLEDVLFRLAAYYQKQDQIAQKIRSALIYPLAMLAMIIVVLLVMLKTVLPAFSGVYQTLTGSLSASSYRYINYAYLFCRIALYVMIAIVVISLILYLMYKGNGKKKVEALLSHNRTIRTILEDLALYRFTSAYEVFLASGEMQDEALLDGMKMADYEPVEEKLKQCARKMEEGYGFAKAANDVQLYEPIYGRMLIPGEKSGDIESTLKRLTGLLSDNVINQTDRVMNTVEPLLSGILMITIGIALLSVMLPLIGIMNSIG
ncbi:MAG: type II secretion system F family protein [Erysipelotrichaceae bacterium]|nr:type II secretion system F family protein [Erysipelotrichaceae bacterium]